MHNAILHILFALSFFALLLSYAIYPSLALLIQMLMKKSKNEDTNLPYVSVVCAAFNEESIIKEKLDSLVRSNYPKDKIEILIGSDGSTDNTNIFINQFSQLFKQIKLIEFEGRNGKPKIIESLIKQSKGDIIISTDANILFAKNTIRQLVSHFKDPAVGLVDSVICHSNIKKDGIAIQEKSYLNIEAKIKHFEGRVFGTMMGPFGACFAMRKNLYKPLPKNFLVDDFHICMNVIQQGYKAINDLEAVVYEDVSNQMQEEIRRKTRIAAGNFQNLFFFKSLWINPFNKAFIPFICHKVIRWIGPFLLITLLLSNFLLLMQNTSQLEYKFVFIGQLTLYIGALFDIILKKIGIHTVFLRYMSHFLGMNLALLLGFIQFINGVKTNVWEPTKRNQ